MGVIRTIKNKRYKYYYQVGHWVFNFDAIDAWHMSPAGNIVTLFMDNGREIKITDPADVSDFIENMEKFLIHSGYNLVGGSISG
jgi:hypothetical protein